MKRVANEEGYILVLGMSMLVILTLFGAFSLRTSCVDLRIAGNERQLANSFYVADTAWQVGRLWLNRWVMPPAFVNSALNSESEKSRKVKKESANLVRNFGNGGDGVINDSFPEGTEDGTYSGLDYWYRIVYRDDLPAISYGEGYRGFREEIQAVAARRTRVNATMYKVYQVGY